MYVVGKTDIGNFREENQDKFQIATIGDSSAFAVVCDGMGGAASGGLASEIASNAVYERISLSFRPEMEQKSIRTMLLSAISAANTIVYNKSIESKENAGMGTTCVTAVLHNNVCSIASVGDSRAYLITPDGIQQITNDHTVVEYLHSKGIISEDEMKVHSMKNVITRAVGVDKGVEADYFEIDVQKGSLILLCTDGLTNVLSDEAIYSMVYGRNVEISVADIVETANAQGSKDNITAVIISV